MATIPTPAQALAAARNEVADRQREFDAAAAAFAAAEANLTEAQTSLAFVEASQPAPPPPPPPPAPPPPPPPPPPSPPPPPAPPPPAPPPAPAGALCVTPAGAGAKNGADWANAFAGLPSALKRGSEYLLGAGNYGTRTFADPVSGTLPITIRKATDADHGPAAGWTSALDGQAVFRSWTITTDYYVFDGVRRNGDWRTGTLDRYGIRVSGDRPLRLDNGAGVGCDNTSFNYIDFRGSGKGSGSGDDIVYGLAGNDNITFHGCAMHDVDRCMFLLRETWDNLLIQCCYIARNNNTATVHSEFMSLTSATNLVIRFNVFEDIEGTAVVAAINGGTLNGGAMYGNTIIHTPNFQTEGLSGVFYGANDSSNNNVVNNFKFYNNTVVGIKGTYSGVVIQKGTGNEVRNNVWHGCVRSANGGNGQITFSHNWYSNTAQDGDVSSTKVVCTSGCDIFRSISGRDFHLSKNTPAGMALPSQYAVDPDGKARTTWSRGAFEFAPA